MAASKNGFWNRRVSGVKKSKQEEPNWNRWFADLEDTSPNLRQFLVGMPVGAERIEGGSVLIYSDFRTPRLRLSDRHHGEIAFSTGLTLEEMLKDAERNLANDSTDWRIDPYAKGRTVKSKR